MIETLTLPIFPTIDGVLAAYSVRTGGVSVPPYASLNLGDHVGDETQRVRINRKRISKQLGIDSERWVTAEQIHGGAVARVTEEDAGREIPGVDALITRSPHLPLALFFADCASLLFYDARNTAIGIAHAGWRGTAAEIARNTVEAMRNCFGTQPDELQAAMGPGIGACCYEVGSEVADTLSRWEGAIREEKGKLFADLRAANRTQLLLSGVSPDRITLSRECTACDTGRFFSYRKEGPTGRMAGLLMLKA